MKKYFGLAAIAAAVIFLTAGTQVFASGKQDAGFSGASMSWESEGAVEAGSLPAGEDLSAARTGSIDGAAKAEYGGLVYRIGIDTN